MHVYVLVDPETDVVRYVGKTTKPLGERRNQHRWKAKQKTHKDYWLNILRQKNLRPRYIVVQYAQTTEELNDLERSWIARGRALGLPLTNMSEGGDGSAGFKRSETTRAKMRAYQGSEEMREAKRKRMKEFSARNPEHYIRIHENLKKKVYVSDGRVFNSCNEARAELGISHGMFYRVLKGVRTKHKLKWALTPFV